MITYNKKMLINEKARYHIEPSLLSLCRPRKNFVSLLHCNICNMHQCFEHLDHHYVTMFTLKYINTIICWSRENFVSLLHCNIYIMNILNMILFISPVPKIITLLHCNIVISYHEHLEYNSFLKYFHLSYRSLHWGQELPEKEGGWSQKTL